MQSHWIPVAAALFAAALLAPGAARADSTDAAAALRAAGQVSPGFVENGGQADARARFHLRRGGITAFFTERTMIIQGVVRPDPAALADLSGANVHLTFEGARSAARLEGENELPGRVSYFTGADPARWAANLKTFDSIRYAGLYHGIDVVVHDTNGKVEYDLVLEPGADPAQVVVRCEGADALSLAEDGALLLHTAIGPLRQERPQTFAVAEDGARREVQCRYLLLDESAFGFAVSGWDSARERLIIDPGLAFATFLGGSGSDVIGAVAAGPEESIYVAGQTLSLDFPTTPGAFDTSFNGSGVGADDVFVAKLNAAGTTLLYATYIGGTNGETFLGEFASDLAVNATGEAIACGTSTASNFPTTAGAFQTNRKGTRDGFVLKLAASGSSLVFSTYLGGGGSENATGVALLGTGEVYVTGDTSSSNFPFTANAFDKALQGPGVFDGFVAVLNAAGSAVTYASYLGGTANDLGLGIDVDASGRAYVTGQSDSTDFPVSPGAFNTTSNGGQDIVALKINPVGAGGSVPEFSTYLGGDAVEAGNAIAVGQDGSVYIAGGVKSANFPITPGAYDSLYSGSGEAFVARLTSNGGGLMYSTFLGGNGAGIYPEQANGIAVNALGFATVTGETDSTNFPAVGDGSTGTLAGMTDAFVSRLEADGSALTYSTLIGGTSGDAGNDVAMNSAGNACVAGRTSSAGLPVSLSAVQPAFGGGYSDGFLALYNIGCTGGYAKFGTGCPGTGAFVPVLSGSGCPEPGFTITILVTKALGGAFGLITVGIGTSQLPVTPYCYILNAPLVLVVPVAAAGSGPGNGTLSFSAPIPPATAAGVVYLQALFSDAGALGGVSSTNGLAIGVSTEPVVGP